MKIPKFKTLPELRQYLVQSGLVQADKVDQVLQLARLTLAPAEVMQ